MRKAKIKNIFSENSSFNGNRSLRGKGNQSTFIMTLKYTSKSVASFVSKKETKPTRAFCNAFRVITLC